MPSVSLRWFCGTNTYWPSVSAAVTPADHLFLQHWHQLTICFCSTALTPTDHLFLQHWHQLTIHLTTEPQIRKHLLLSLLHTCPLNCTKQNMLLVQSMLLVRSMLLVQRMLLVQCSVFTTWVLLEKQCGVTSVTLKPSCAQQPGGGGGEAGGPGDSLVLKQGELAAIPQRP